MVEAWRYRHEHFLVGLAIAQDSSSSLHSLIVLYEYSFVVTGTMRKNASKYLNSNSSQMRQIMFLKIWSSSIELDRVNVLI